MQGKIAAERGESRAEAWLPGFVWALPEAFAPAVSAYHFEQGDVIHRTRAAYGPLAEPLPEGLTTVQVLQPPRSARALPSELEGDRRLASWQSEVELARIDLAAGRVEPCVTTQGRLFTALWKGDEHLLGGEGEPPPLPRSARELFALLREDGLVLPPPVDVARGARFLFVVDRSSDAARAKAAAIAAALHPLGRVETRDRGPLEAHAEEAERFHPTLVVRELVLRDVEADALEIALRGALYGGSGDADRFSLGRHGVLESLGRGGATRSGEEA